MIDQLESRLTKRINRLEATVGRLGKSEESKASSSFFDGQSPLQDIQAQV